jgi:hypothetical protein
MEDTGLVFIGYDLKLFSWVSYCLLMFIFKDSIVVININI